MQSVINQNIFKHQGGASSGMNNLVTVIHLLKMEGGFRGEVYFGESRIANFQIKYRKELEANTQIDIDASGFDPIYSRMMKRAVVDRDKVFEVGGDGYVVFHVSGHQGGVHFMLYTINERREEAYFDSRKLGSGDMVVLRPVYPGKYVVQNEAGNELMELEVKKAENGRYYHPSKLEPKQLKLQKGGFETKKVELWPLQALVIVTEVDASIVLKYMENRKQERERKTRSN
jgi:hypothetical protein